MSNKEIIEELLEREVWKPRVLKNVVNEILNMIDGNDPRLVKKLIIPAVSSSLFVLDKQTNTKHKLVSIDVDNDKVVMKSDDYGYTSNKLNNVVIYYE